MPFFYQKDGSTTILKKNKQITQVGGLGGTHYSITKQAAGRQSLPADDPPFFTYTANF